MIHRLRLRIASAGYVIKLSHVVNLLTPHPSSFFEKPSHYTHTIPITSLICFPAYISHPNSPLRAQVTQIHRVYANETDRNRQLVLPNPVRIFISRYRTPHCCPLPPATLPRHPSLCAGLQNSFHVTPADGGGTCGSAVECLERACVRANVQSSLSRRSALTL